MMNYFYGDFLDRAYKAAPLRLCPTLSNVTTTENHRCRHELVDILGSPTGFDLLPSLATEQHGWCSKQSRA